MLRVFVQRWENSFSDMPFYSIVKLKLLFLCYNHSKSMKNDFIHFDKIKVLTSSSIVFRESICISWSELCQW